MRRPASIVPMIVALLVALTLLPASVAAVPGYDLMDSVSIDSNAWVAWKVTLPPNAEFRNYTVTFDGFERSGRLRFDTWRLRPPYTGSAGYGGIYGFSSTRQARARVQVDPSIGADVNAAPLLVADPESAAVGGGLSVGDNIVVAVIAGAHDPVRGTLSLWLPRSNGPPGTVGEPITGSEAFFHTEYDFDSDEALVHASLAGTQVVWMRDATLREQIDARFFGLFWSHADSSSHSGPAQGGNCGNQCWLFHGTSPGMYDFVIESNERVGLFAGEVQVFGADVDLTPLM